MRVDHVPPVTPRDRMLVEWVAQAKVGDPLPAAMVLRAQPAGIGRAHPAVLNR